MAANFDSDFFKKYATLATYISRGASGSVFGPIQCNDKQLTIKQVMFTAGEVTDKFIEDIEAKQKIWTSLEHEHLTRILSVDLSQLPKAMFIVMEFAAGGSLYDTLRSLGSENKLPIDVVTNWAKQIAEGMLYLHERNIVHRDLKSSNILLMAPLNTCKSHMLITLKIADFDNVKKLDHTTTMSLVGTCAYMAPEVLATERFSKASDIWSFGVVIWEMLSGDIPYDGLDSRAILYKSAKGELDKLNIELPFPEDYKLILKKCWASICKERLSFDEIVRVLKCMAKGKDVTEILREYEIDRVDPKEELEESPRESHVIRSNQQFLMENIDSSRLVDLLHEKSCIADEERFHMIKQPINFNRNDALLQWMRAIPLKQEKGQKVLECFRQTKQNFVADLLVRGGVVIKSQISTKMVKVSLLTLFTKASTKHAKGLTGKLAMVIHRLNHPQGLSLSSIQNATSEIPDDDIVIAPYCHQESDGIVVWFWCKSKHGQRNLQRMYESGILLAKLSIIFKEFSNDSVSSASTLLIPTGITIFVGDITKNLSELPEQFQSDPVLIKSIKSKAGEERRKPIEGLTILDKELFVVSEGSSEIEVYDSIKLSFSRRWNLKELFNPFDITACNRNKCLYIFDGKGIDQSSEILRVDPNGNLIKNWSTGDDYGLLSVTDESNVILTVYKKNKLNEYSPDGQLIRKINLSSHAHIRSASHAIKLTNGNFVVSCGYRDDDLHRVCIVDAEGNLMKSFGGKRGSNIGLVNLPVYLSIDGNGFVLVVDKENHRVLLLDSNLEFKREILSDVKHGLRRPSKILLDDLNGRMLVADNEWNDEGRILIFQFCL